MSIKVGTLCVVVKARHHEEFIGRECTVVGGLEERTGKDVFGNPIKGMRYRIELEGEAQIYLAKAGEIEPKKFPPKEYSSDEEAFRRFLDKTLMPLAVEQMEEA